MGNALNIARRLTDDTKGAAKPSEILDARFSDNALRNPPSLQALKLQDMLMKAAGGKIAEECWHSMPLASFKAVKGFRNLTHDDVVRLFEELRSTTMRHVNTAEGYTGIYGMIAVGRVDMDEGAGQLRWQFDAEFRRVIENSDIYAVLDYRAGLAMKSRYAHRLHEMVAIRANLDKQVQTFTIEDLRARLGIQTGKLKRWPDFKRYALDRAISEVNHASRFRVSYRVTKHQRRAVAEIELSWAVRPSEELDKARREQSAHSVAREGRRREGTPSTPSFPADGSVSFGQWGDMVRKHAPKPTPDVDLVASRFRTWAASKGLQLDSKKIETTFIGFCRRFK